MTPPQRTEPAISGAGYRLVVPDEWFTVDLDPGPRERSVRALVERQFAGIDNAPHLKAQAREELLAKAGAAYDGGGLDMFLSLQQIAGIPLAASLVVFLVPAPGDGRAADAGQLAGTLRGDDREVSVTELPAGKSVRVLRRSATGGSEPGADAATLEVFVPVPGSGAWLLLSFCAPIGPLAPAMTKLFDAICTTLRWDK
jgi:hypothetical protein